MDELFTPEVMARVGDVNNAEWHRRIGSTKRRLPLTLTQEERDVVDSIFAAVKRALDR